MIVPSIIAHRNGQNRMVKTAVCISDFQRSLIKTTVRVAVKSCDPLCRSSVQAIRRGRIKNSSTLCLDTFCLLWRGTSIRICSLIRALPMCYFVVFPACVTLLFRPMNVGHRLLLYQWCFAKNNNVPLLFYCNNLNRL